MSGKEQPEGAAETEASAAGAAPYASAAELLAGLGELPALIGPPPRPGLIGLIDRFEVLREIGRGGMGIVLLGYDPAGRKLVAIKMIHPDLARQARAVHRFLLEATHAAKLKHPHVLPVLEVGQREDQPYFVMPYLPWGSLARLIKPGVPLEESLAQRVGMGVAEALKYAHQRGITHRDLKPDNVLLDESGEALLGDFGLARTVFNDSIVDVQRPGGEGTAAYMAPEIARGEAGDTRCDIYSFGALMYEMITGHPPYEGRTAAELMRKVVETDPVPVKERNPNAPAGLVKIVEGAMAKDLAERYATMGHVVEDLRRVERGEEPRGPHGLRQRPRAFRVARRRSVMLTIAAALLIATIALLWMDRQSHPPPPTGNEPAMAPSDPFDGMELDTAVWKQGVAHRFSSLQHPGTGNGRSFVSEGALILEARAEHERGFSSREHVWVDSLADLKTGGNLQLDVDLAATGEGGIVGILVTDGRPPSDGESESVASYRYYPSHPGKWEIARKTVRTTILPAAGYALVSDGSGDQKLIDVRHLDRWHVRVQVTAQTSDDLPPGTVQLRVEGVRARPITVPTAVLGRVFDGGSERPIAGATVVTRNGVYGTKSDSEGFFRLDLNVHEHELWFRAPGFLPLVRRNVDVGPASQLRVDVPLQRAKQAIAVTVVETIPFGGWFSEISAVLASGKKLFFGVPQGDCTELFELDLAQPSRKPVHRVRLETDTSQGTRMVGLNGTSSYDGKWYALAWHPGRLIELDPDIGIRSARRLDLNWTSGLGIEGDQLWFLETTDLAAKRGVHCWDLKTFLPLVFCESEDNQIRGLAFGGGRLWISSLNGLLYCINPNEVRPGRMLEDIIEGVYPGGYDYISFGGGYLWGIDLKDKRIDRIAVGAPTTAPASRPSPGSLR